MVYELKERTKIVIKNFIDTTLKLHGFKKNGITYHKDNGDLIFLVELQNCAHYEDVEYSFFINTAVFCKSIHQSIHKTALEKPKHYDCLINNRIETIAKRKSDRYSIKIETDIDLLGNEIAEDLKILIEYFSKISSKEDIIRRIIERKDGASINFGFFEYLIKENRSNDAVQFIRNAGDQFEDKSRWTNIMQKYSQIAKENNIEINI